MEKAKWFAGILLMVGCICFGWNAGTQAIRRWKELDCLYRILLSLQGEVRYGGSSLELIFRRIRERLGSSTEERHCADWLAALGEDIREGKNSFFELWEKNRRRFWEKECFQAEELRLLQGLGANLGAVDQKQQLKLLDYYLEEFRKLSRLAYEESRIRSRLYRNLGVLGAAFLMILLL